MSDSLTTDRFRILRDARVGAGVLKPKSCFLDVERPVHEPLVMSREGRLDLTPRGAAQLLPRAAR